MAKNPTYWISAVRYDVNHNHITRLRVHPNNNNTVGSATAWDRNLVVSQIESGQTFVTIWVGSNNQWQRGSDVEVVVVNGVKYLRTDRNNIAADNLENLPEF